MASKAETDRGFGLMRALSRVKNSSKSHKVGRIVESVQLKPSSRAQKPSRPRSAAELAEAQKTLKEQAAEQGGGLELWPLPGLAPMTRVRTAFGDVHAIALRKGDKVLTKSGDFMRIEWINRIMLDEHILQLKPDSNPIVIAPGALNAGVPSHEIMVSPRQIFCADERSGLTKPREASMLLSRTGIRRLRETGLTYTMFHVGQSADVYCEGLYLNFPIET